MLKFTCPGTPDVYQGCEHWDLSLVDPDNRRAVDYEKHKGLLAQNPSLPKLWKDKFNGQIKVWLTQLLMQERKKNPMLFAEGNYIPLTTEGKYAENILAFARQYRRTWYLIVVPLNLPGPKDADWEDTRVMLPDSAPENFENLVSGIKGKQKQEFYIKDVFTVVPFALLKLQQPVSERSSGVLMHITSLPSKFGLGDLGPGAKSFADILHGAYQSYWQLLPLSPVDEQSGFSPYSTFSSLAGNTLLLSPDLLVRDSAFDWGEYVLPDSDKVDYKQASRVKLKIFENAWSAFKTGSEDSKASFLAFCKNEASWLNEHAVYVVLKQRFNNKPWYTWPDEFKLRNKKALADFDKISRDAVEQEKWLQFQFSKQWNSLKSYCNGLGIQLFGDLPFYVSYDSVDVWAHPELFSLDDEGNMAQVAGVPPDYFSADGQLWGMPVFCWDKLKEQGYEWWLLRIRKNLERYDLLRLDHFRAFTSCWSVPAGDKTAVNGKWVEGPGADLFKAFKKEFGQLPFVAEDLGDIDEAVYQLRDEFHLPGMRVLQFAFGPQVPQSPHAPHNYSKNSIAYTGTHDNNTTKGWYSKEADAATRSRINTYIGSKISAKNINDAFMRAVMSSPAKIAIIPMQDVLDLNEENRMNFPGMAGRSWLWRITDDDQWQKQFKKMKIITQLYNRI